MHQFCKTRCFLNLYLSPFLQSKKVQIFTPNLLWQEVKYHPSKSLHHELFDPSGWQKWIDPRLGAMLTQWHQAEEPKLSMVDLESFKELKALAPGIFCFPCFTSEFCQKLLEEVKHYQDDVDLPDRPPNTMNKYGLVLNEIGMMPLFSEMMTHVMSPLATLLFGNDDDRVPSVKGQPTTGNWGGSQLDTHHTFVVQYAVEEDKNLDMHIDECDITFNIGLTETLDFEGNQLAFCGMYDADDHRKHLLTYTHVRGQCIVHCGKQRHGALDIEDGERASLIMWTKSHAFRRTEEYRHLYDLTKFNLGDADRICLSYSHDDDYEELMPEELQFQMPKPDPMEVMIMKDGHGDGEDRVWTEICKDSDVTEGEHRIFHLPGHDVLLLRHKGELFALENRCGHMGTSLATGDVEDLADGHAVGIRCPGHGICFDLRTGRSKGGWKQPVYQLRNQDGQIEVCLDRPLTDHGRKRKRPVEIDAE